MALELQRKEWGPFKGLYANQIGSTIPDGYAVTATDCLLDNNVIEVNAGDSFYAQGAGGTQPNAALLFTAPYYDFATPFGSALDKIIECGTNTGNNFVYTVSTTATNFGHVDSNVSVSNGSTAVTGVGTTWNDNTTTGYVKAGDYVRSTTPAGGGYSGTVSTVNSNTSITLTGNWSGSTLTNASATFIQALTVGANYSNNALMSNGYLLVTNRTDFMIANNGATANIVPTAPKVWLLENFKSRVFGANTSANPHRVFWCPVNNPTGTWDTTNAQTDIFPYDGGTEIVAIKTFQNRLFVFKQTSGLIYEVRGDFATTTGTPDSIIKVSEKGTSGRLYGKTLVEKNGLLYFYTSTGWYAFDGSQVVLINRALESQTNSVLDTVRNRYFATLYKDRIYLNLGSTNKFAILDKNNSVTIHTSPTNGVYIGGFAQVDLGWNNLNLYGLSCQTSNGFTYVVNIDDATSYTRYNGQSTAPNVNNTLQYEIGDDYLDAPEYMKNFYKFYIVTEETSATNSFLFDYDIDKTGTYLPASPTITITGTANKIRVWEVDIVPFGNISTSRGRCIRWRIRGNNTAVNFRIIKVILRYSLMSLR